MAPWGPPQVLMEVIIGAGSGCRRADAPFTQP